MKKNIHILETDQPSRFYFNMKGILSKDELKVRLKNQNINITSSEEIKVDTWITNGIDVFKPSDMPEYSLVYANKYWKKVILSTDPTLIADGVQAIDDKFLEWFCQNPTCEFVEVKELLSNNGNAFYGYKIIIPQEEPKLDNLEERFKRDMSMVVMPLDNENIPEEPNKLYVVINLIELYKMVVM
jgi:hypothetical protein